MESFRGLNVKRRDLEDIVKKFDEEWRHFYLNDLNSMLFGYLR